MKSKVIVIILMALLAPVLLISVSAEFSGEYFINENCGFGVDSQGRAYIGTKKYIYVYEQCELYKKIYIDPYKMYKNYRFTVQKNDTILLANEKEYYELDLDGNLIKEYEEEKSGSRFNELQSVRIFEDANGNTYGFKETFGRTELVCRETGEVVYRLPSTDYAFKLMLNVSAIGEAVLAIILTLIFTKKEWKKHSATQKTAK